MKLPQGYGSLWECAVEAVAVITFLVVGVYLVGIASTIEFIQ